jgi:hypothetical protein
MPLLLAFKWPLVFVATLLLVSFDDRLCADELRDAIGDVRPAAVDAVADSRAFVANGELFADAAASRSFCSFARSHAPTAMETARL